MAGNGISKVRFLALAYRLVGKPNFSQRQVKITTSKSTNDLIT